MTDEFVKVTITHPSGALLECFDVSVDGGWQLHKVAAEIRTYVEHAYRIGPGPSLEDWRKHPDTTDIPEAGEDWFKRARLVKPKE